MALWSNLKGSDCRHPAASAGNYASDSDEDGSDRDNSDDADKG